MMMLVMMMTQCACVVKNSAPIDSNPFVRQSTLPSFGSSNSMFPFSRFLHSFSRSLNSRESIVRCCGRQSEEEITTTQDRPLSVEGRGDEKFRGDARLDVQITGFSVTNKHQWHGRMKAHAFPVARVNSGTQALTCPPDKVAPTLKTLQSSQCVRAYSILSSYTLPYILFFSRTHTHTLSYIHTFLYRLPSFTTLGSTIQNKTQDPLVRMREKHMIQWDSQDINRINRQEHPEDNRR